ncbi:uncharacterized protein LOC111070780 isoform X2 [Drosophila obscura]|uniref:uncharacterized protein LOC111070780 isoform X2 n=1 Tax=Drosophila obscura TaxID=7282 RepID=UPI001BB1D594|nr:uncharacterized protein LOC111070780 isoform X2 [Drosophila obscura]
MDSNSEVVPQTEVVVTDMAPEENAERLVTSVETSQSVNSSIDESNVDSSSVVIEKESDQDAKVSDEIPKTTVAIVDLIVVTDTETPTSETAEMEIVETETAESETAETETAATETAAIAVVETEVENLVTTEIDASSFANHQDVPTYETSNNAIDLETEPQVNAKSQDKEVEETKYAEETESEDETESVTEEDIVENAIDLPEKSEVPSEVIESQTVLVKASANEKGTELKEKSNEFSDISTQKANEVADVRLSNDQKNFNNQIQDIISDIDINIKTQEKITKLKEQELKLIQKQNELTNQIQQQQILAQQLTAQNQFKQKQWEQQQIEKQEFLSSKINQQDGLCSTQSHLHTAYNQSDDSHNKKETTNLSKSIDLRKIFTPATDAVEILPKNRKLYASSAFYSPNLHPTVEDQVELARRISHSLSDISNQTSKGQTMYVNRKKRSVKWVHEEEDCTSEVKTFYKENTDANSMLELTKLEKIPLKLIMNPRGQVRDYNSVKESINVETGLLSPDNCAELITALKLHQGRGAELFAKRRRKADNWVVDETNAGTQSHPSGLPDYQQYQPKPATSPNILPAYSDAGKHRVQLNIHQDQLIEKYSKPGLQVVKSPWEAALQTGSASSAFLEESKPRSLTPSSVPKTYFHSGGNDLTDAGEPVSYGIPLSNQQESFKKSLNHQQSSILPTNPQRELAYKPSVAQGWGGRNVELPREYFDFNEPLSSWEENNNEQCNNQYISEEHDILRENVQMGHGQNQSLDFEVNVQTRLHQLEQFQKYFLEQQRLEIEILKRRDDSRLFRLTKLYHEQFKHESPNEERLHNEDVLQTGRSTDEEINENVNVQDLIYSFEQQSLREHTESARPRNQNCSTYLSSEATKADNETGGLYVPKEISLASYAPPPKNFTDQQPAYSGHNISSINTTYESHRPLPTASIANETSVGTSWGFPVSKPIASGFSTIPPKQQLSAPASYQKIPQTSALGAPQVNFNPSPLSYEKLSKFEQPNLSYPNQNYLNVRQTSQVRNASPTPFAFGSNEARFSGSHASRSPSSIASISPQPLRSPCISTRYGQPSNNAVPRLTSSSQAQTFNNCARGWGTEPESQYIYPGPNVLPAPGNMPYSDF